MIDLRDMPANANATGLHWQVSQATSLINVVVEMSTEPGNYHRGALEAVLELSLTHGCFRTLHGERQVMCSGNDLVFF